MDKAQRCPVCKSLLRFDRSSKSLACPYCDSADPIKTSEGWLNGELGRSSENRERNGDDSPN